MLKAIWHGPANWFQTDITNYVQNQLEPALDPRPPAIQPEGGGEKMYDLQLPGAGDKIYKVTLLAKWFNHVDRRIRGLWNLKTANKPSFDLRLRVVFWKEEPELQNAKLRNGFREVRAYGGTFPETLLKLNGGFHLVNLPSVQLPPVDLQT